MTDKKKKILSVALELFAHDGFSSVSTSRIAKTAGVSEGLIFKHFENKKGLLEALVAQAISRVTEIISPILISEDPLTVIEKTIAMPFSIPKEEYPFWKLQFKLKWENDYDNTDKMKPLIDKLSWAFSSLGYPAPQQEALVLNHIIDSVATGILRDGMESQEVLRVFLISKYTTPPK